MVVIYQSFNLLSMSFSITTLQLGHISGSLVKVCQVQSPYIAIQVVYLCDPTSILTKEWWNVGVNMWVWEFVCPRSMVRGKRKALGLA